MTCFSCHRSALLALTALLCFVGPVRAQQKEPGPSPEPTVASPSSPAATPATAPSVAASATASAKMSPGSASPQASGTPATVASPGVSTPPASPGAPTTPTPLVIFPPTPGAAPSGIVTNGNPTVIVVQQPASAPPPQQTNSWIPGLIGMGLFAAALVFGIRYAKQRGMTVEGGLKQLGVEMPQEGITTAPPARPTPVSEPPLPSLADLPPPQPVPGTPPAANISSFKSKVVESGPQAPIIEPSARTASATLLGLSGSTVGDAFAIGEGLTVGREKDNILSLPQEGTVSRRHARIDWENGNWVVSDLGSSNGTYVNGKRLTSAQILRRGDEVQFGSARFRFEA